MVPPTHRPGSASQPPRQTWPTVLGIFMLVFGILAVLGGLIGAATPFFTELLSTYSGEEELLILSKWKWWTFTSALLLTALGVLQIVASAGLLNRRSWALKACVTWSILKILIVCGTDGLNFVIQSEQIESTLENDTGSMGPMEEFMGIVIVGFAVLGLLWSWALPVFNLIWFSRSKVHDDIQRWGEHGQ